MSRVDEKPHAVGRREHQPVIARQAVDGGIERRRVRDRPHLDRRSQQHLGTQASSAAAARMPSSRGRVTTIRCPKSGSCSNHASSFAERDDGSDDQQSRGAQAGARSRPRRSSPGCDRGALRGSVPAFDDGGRRVAGLAQLASKCGRWPPDE